MAKETIKYILDNEEEVVIVISYDDNLELNFEKRAILGGFTLPDDLLRCGSLLTRNKLKPRLITVKNPDDGKELKIICKTKERLLEIINNPQDFINNADNTTKAIPIRYSGESYCITNDSSS